MRQLKSKYNKLFIFSMKREMTVLFFLLALLGLKAQEIQGKVTNEKGLPLAGVVIGLKGESQTEVTNDLGFFRLTTKQEGKQQLTATLPGYRGVDEKVVLVKGQTIEINFVLSKKTELLKELAVEGEVYKKNVALESATSTKSDLKLIDTPAPVVVVTSGVIEDQGITTIQGAIQNISGVTQAGNNYGIGDNLVIRGLGANYAYDGMYGGGGLGNTYNPIRTMTNVDRVEVLKGSSTGLYGIGSAGGVFNMVEKKPLDYEKITGELQVGRWDYYRLMMDASLPLSERWAIRIVAAKEAATGYRSLKRDVNETYATIKYKLAKNNTFILSSAYIEDENQIDAIGNPVRIFNRESLADPSDTDITWEDLVNDSDADGDGVWGIQLTEEQRRILASSITSTTGIYPYDLGDGNLISPLSDPNKGNEFRVKLRNDWSIGKNTELIQQALFRTYKSNYTRQTGAFNYVYWNRNGEINASPRAPLVINDVIYPYAARRQEYRHQESKEKVFQYFADLKNKWKLNAIKGQHLLSVNYLSLDTDLKSWSIYDADGTAAGDNAVPYIFDIRNPNWGAGTFWDYSPSLRSNYNKEIETYGVSFQEVVQLLGDRLTGRLGGAYTKTKQTYTQKGTDRNGNLATLPASTDDDGFTYNLGLNYRVLENLGVFVSYAKGRTAYSILGSVTGEDDRPDSESKSFDVGLRYALNGAESKLYASVAYFKTSRTNLRYSNPDYNDNVNDPDYNVDVPQYFYDDEDETEGVEMDINLVLNKHWSLNTNATYQDAIQIRSGEESGQIKGVPKRFVYAWAEYRLFLKKAEHPIRLNAGYKYTSERTVNVSSFGLPTAYLPDYSLWTAAASFKYKKWDIRLNLDNVFNKRYYSKALFLGGLPGDTRNLKVSLKYSL